MSFVRAYIEVQALERRVAELERLARGKDAEIQRRSNASQTTTATTDFNSICALIAKDTNTREEDSQLAEFIDAHQSLSTGMNILEAYGVEKRDKLVQLLATRLEGSNTASVGLEQLRLAKGLYRETLEPALAKPTIFLNKLTLSEPRAVVREEAAKCLNNILFQNLALRDAWIESEQGVDTLLVGLTRVGDLVRNPLASSNSEARTLLLCLKPLFQSSHGDELVARLFIKSGLMAAVVERLSVAFIETQTETLTKVSLVSETCEALARGNLLIDGFRLMFILASFAQDEVLAALLSNEGKPALESDQLEACDLKNPALGMGDRYVFLQTSVLEYELPLATSTVKDQANFDQIKIRVANLLMFANRAPGFVAYLYRHRVGPKLVNLFYRQTSAVLSPERTTSALQEDLLPLIMALKCLSDASEDFLLEFQELFFAKLQPELDATKFNSKEEFDQAKEQRHFAGLSVPDTPFGNCVALLTCYDENIKRMAGEFLYDLCDSSADKVTKLVGFGHAAHLLAIKGGMIGQIMAGQNKN